jgi:hypothetical protein
MQPDLETPAFERSACSLVLLSKAHQLVIVSEAKNLLLLFRLSSRRNPLTTRTAPDRMTHILLTRCKNINPPANTLACSIP